MEQLVARRAHNPKVTGSSPVPATPKDTRNSILFYFISFSPSCSYPPRRSEIIEAMGKVLHCFS
jgi:hypothetical protein